ncbi:PREDICTED: armadillo repeat-containing protein 8-like isoform X2 [Nicrophorus vespilloides]|uniref:Armadillo repeat-containing protein 8 n=1 Tax=Nicrophorus vespilloides TaxID=110193 RepID=A0ABM1MCS3_NICVS|nr:PREDICTED: armadillo repeat-containing protein 8-like isoform X2 [Nicrophorus vespilloides]
MIDTMYPFMAFMNVESSRSYIDDLYSLDSEKCLSSIICIKNSVIGSNRQKESVIAQGIVPRLLQLLENQHMTSSVRFEAAVTIGSLAKGTYDHIELLIDSGTVPLLLNIIEENDSRLVDACLCCLRTLSHHDTRPSLYTEKQLKKLLEFAGPTDSLLRQSCVASILTSACKSPNEQNALCTVGAPRILASLISVEHVAVRLPVLTCLAAMCYNNRVTSEQIANTTYQDLKIPCHLVEFVNRDKPVEIQLEAAKCLTNLYRADAISSKNTIILYKTLPCLVRLCQIEHSESQRAMAADTLAYLTEVDSELQQTAAISNQLVAAIADLLNCQSVAARQAAFRAFASLGANDEDIRKRIIETHKLMERVVDGLGDQEEAVRLATLRCLHSLSRSVQQLRTTFQDHSVWKPLMTLLTGSPPAELLTVASSSLCNLLLEFSPAKEPMIQLGVVQFLAALTTRPEAALRLNGIWALMNLAFQTEQRVKSQILTALGTDQIFRLLADSDVEVLMKTLGLLRNLVSPREHTDNMMVLHGPQVMQAVVLVLEGPHSPQVKEQALCILVNIADGERARDHIMENEDVLKKLRDYMTHPAPVLQTAAIYCIGNLVRKGESGSNERQIKLRDMGVLSILQQLVSTADGGLSDRKGLRIILNIQ